MKTDRFAPIGVFDSGLGGISVLKKMREMLPNENFFFFGDHAHAPYGNRTPDEVLSLSREALALAMEKGCKAFVIACNTATGVAAPTIRRENPSFPIVAIEPALKPAVLENPGKKILLMATPLAIQTNRIQNLVATFEDRADVEVLPCPGLVELIEEGHWNDSVLVTYLSELFADKSPDALVLGCTHYPHVAPALSKFFKNEVRLYDGGEGTARRLRTLLTELDLRSTKTETGSVELFFSGDAPKSYELASALLSF